MNALKLCTHFETQFCIEIGKGFVQQNDVWLERQHTGKRHALLLTTRHLRRQSVAITLDAKLLQDVIDNALTFDLGDLMQLQAELDVLLHSHVRPEGIILEHQSHAALFRWHIDTFINRNDLFTVD